MCKKQWLLLAWCFVSFSFGVAQNFSLLTDDTYEEFHFESVGNLIFLPVEVNGVPLTFVLDSGVNKTVIFNLSEADSLEVNDTQEIYLKGLGKKEPFKAIISRNNTFRIKNLLDEKHNVFIVLDDDINFSKRLGVTVHGIIGFNLLKDFVVRIDYARQKIRFYPHKNFNKKLKRNQEQLPLHFFKAKPYIDTNVLLDTQHEVKLLIDTGNSDALWLFEEEGLQVPEKHFDDYLGKGLSGDIFGKRTKVKQFAVNDFVLEEVKCAFPSEEALGYVKKYEERSGSLGAEVLGRFKIY